jgi:hypothetical protein
MDNLLSKTTGDSGLYWDIEVTPEDEDEMISKIAEKIHQYGLDLPAILMIESVKPLDERREIPPDLRETRERGETH